MTINIRCPQCKIINGVKSSGFGREFVCNKCGYRFTLDVQNLAHFELPNSLEIYLINNTQKGLSKKDFITILIEYGYKLPPLKINVNGKIVLKKEMFMRAQNDSQIDRADFTLNRFILIRIPSSAELCMMAENRKNSGWPILPFETELYRDFEGLMKAYKVNSNDKIISVESKIDLEDGEENIKLNLFI